MPHPLRYWIKAHWTQPEQARLDVLLVLHMGFLHFLSECIPSSTIQPGPLAHTALTVFFPAGCLSPGLLAAQVGGVQGGEYQSVGVLEPLSASSACGLWEPV